MNRFCFEYGIALSRLEQDKKLQHFRVAKFTYLCLEQGQGFIESAEPPGHRPRGQIYSQISLMQKSDLNFEGLEVEG